MSDTDLSEFKEFLAFKAMKAKMTEAPVPAPAPAPAPAPDLTGAAAVRARMAVLAAAPVRRMDWSKTLEACLLFVFNSKARPDMWSSNSEWWLWRQIYLADPAAFRLLGELHNDRETGECYITARYDFGATGAYACFHLYGTTEGTRFSVSKVSWSQNGKKVSTRDLWARHVPGGVSGGAGSSSASVLSFGSE